MAKIVPGSGDPGASLWLIGEAPGQTEVVEGEPFVGNAGMTLRRFLMQTGIDPHDCYFDNIYQKRAPGDKLQRLFKAGVPNSDVVASIASLNTRIREYRPNLIVTLGAIPTAILTDSLEWNPKYGTFTSIQDYRGSILQHKEIPEQKVIPTYHPSYINREGYSDHGIFLADLERVLRESAFPEIRRPKKEFILNPRGPKLQEVKERLLDTAPDGIITCDIEYIGSKLLCIGLTNSSEWATAIGIHSETELNVCREILTSGRGLNMQNSAFDASILEWHYGIPTFEHIAYDTMLAAHAISPELPKGLDFLCSIYTDQPYYKSMVDWDLIKKGKQSIEIVYEYNCIDVWTQHEIMECQLREDFAERPDLYETFQFELALLKPLWEISKRGMRVDPGRMQKYREELLANLELDRQIITVINGGAEVNEKSGNDVADMLFGYLKLRPGGKTKTGKFKVDDTTLASVLGRAKTAQQQLAIKHIRAARRKRDLLSKFVDAELDEDGRTRGMYNPSGTNTGRLSSKKFYPTGRGHQQQNIPRQGRHVIVADPGMRFGSVDYERAESLVVAHLTNDAIMLGHHEPGADAHSLLAALFLTDKNGHEVGPDEVTKDQRYLFKKTRHAGNYMEGHITFMRDVNKYAHITGVSIITKEAEEFITWYREVHLGLKPWWLDTRETLFRDKELTNLLGRSRTFFDRTDSILPKAIAFVPQGTVGDLVNIGLLNMSGVITEKHKQFVSWWEEVPEVGAELSSLGFQLLNQVHDSIGFQFPPKNETRVLEIVHRCLHIPLRNPHTHKEFYIGQEVKLGNSWGEAS